MPTAITTNIDQLAKAFDALALEVERGIVTSFDYIGDFAVKQMLVLRVF